ncbi:MAG: carbohydrate binding domain-containing protein [Bacteroidota bacterium]
MSDSRKSRRFWMVGLLLQLTVSSIIAGVANPSFETDLSGWESWQGTLTRVSLGDAPDGSYVAKVTRSTGSSFTIDDNPASVSSTVAGQKYWASAWVKAASSSSLGKTVTLRLREINSSGVLVKETVSPGIALTNSFQQLFVTVTVTASGNTLDLRISQGGAASGDAFYADLFDLSSAPVENLVSNASFETDLTGWESWQGTLARVAMNAPDGGYAAKVTRSTGTSFTIDDNPDTVTSTTAGQTYTGSVWVAAASSTSQGKTVTLRMRERTPGGTLVQEWVSTGAALSNTFKKLSVTAIPQTTGDTLDIRISQAGAASGDAFYADLFVITAGAPPTGEPAEKRPFDPQHPVYQPIPPNCPLYQYSSTIVNNIVNKYKHFNFDIGGETSPVYVGQPSDPIWTLVMPNGTFYVHAPDTIRAGTGSDYPLIILDKSSSGYNSHPVEYRMWRAVVDKSQRRVTCQGGGVGVFANDGRVLEDIPIQAGRVRRALGQAEIFGQNTGSGNSYTVGMIRPIDIQRGRIDHAIRVAIGYPHPTRWFWPALRTETWGANANYNSPMGARIFLDPSVDVNAIADVIDGYPNLDAKNKAFARIFLVALKEYGLIALDGTNGSCDPHTCGHNIYFEADTTANWESLIGKKNAWGTYNDIARAIRDNLPWDKLRVADGSVFDGYAHEPY